MRVIQLKWISSGVCFELAKVISSLPASIDKNRVMMPLWTGSASYWRFTSSEWKIESILHFETGLSVIEGSPARNEENEYIPSILKLACQLFKVYQLGTMKWIASLHFETSLSAIESLPARNDEHESFHHILKLNCELLRVYQPGTMDWIVS